MPPSFFNKFFGRTISDAAAFGIGGALEKPLEPGLQELSNETWRAAVKAGTTKPVEPGDAAEIVGEDVELSSWGSDQAAQSGIGGAQFAALVQAVLNAPGVGELLTILRRHPDAADDFTHGLRKNRLETRWDGYLKDLANAKLSPQELAVGIVRSVVADPGLLAVTLDTSGSNVAKYPEYPGDALREASAAGINEDQLRVLVGEVGLPMAAQAAALAYFRGVITRGAYNQAILEGDTRPEWAESILEASRHILTPHEYAELQLRGYIDQAARDAGAAKVGMTPADTELLYNVLGRAPAVHQVVVGLARGGAYPGSYANVPEPYRSAIQRGNIREEWAELVYAARYTYPSGFQIKSEAQAGDLTADETASILLEIGWDPKWAAFFAEKWAGKATVTAKPKKLTNATIRTAWKKAELTREQALQRLEDNGLSADDAAIFLGA